jgi:hypothetical protein
VEYDCYPTEARLIPELELWVFYDRDGNVLAKVSHELIERTTLVCDALHEREMDARIDEMMKLPKTGW